ncbi:NACHT domain-containing protein [Nonomuraea sp. NPDC049714]|uniref:NACHT domain-containing protein n=1 Tax=Nonomuraea sp. NPDC049714 TaxID=3364357 RepID=UPI0037A51D8F
MAEAARALYDQLRALEARAQSARMRAGQVGSRREAANEVRKTSNITLSPQRISDWLAKDPEKAQIPLHRDFPKVWELVKVWSRWAGTPPPDQRVWKRLVENAQPLRLPRGETGASDAILRDYRDQVINRYGFLTLAGIPVESDNLELGRIRLSSVYVKLEALPETGRTQEGPIEIHLGSDGSHNKPREAVIKTAEWLWQQSRLDERPNEHRAAIVPENIVRHGPPCVVILGVPGSGKSTMMRMLAARLASGDDDYVPIYVNLAEAEVSDSISLQDAALNQAVALLYGDGSRSRTREALERAIEEDHVCFLFDGLDEAHSDQDKIWEELRVIGSTIDMNASHARVVVTSRPSGYSALPFAHYRILPLLPRDSQLFIEKWFTVLASMKGPTLENPEDWIRNNVAWLSDQLEARPQLRDIASNPLMLTFLTLYAGEDVRKALPNYRKDLYRDYIEKLFASWESRRRRSGYTTTEQTGEYSRTFYTWFIYQVARRIHMGYYGRSPDDSPTEQRLVSLLQLDLQQHWDVGRKGESLTKDGLEFWRTAGLLRKTQILKGKEWYLFRHQTFQEYGTARALAEQYATSPDDLWEELKNYRHMAAWAEVIPLTMGCLANFGVKSNSFIKALLADNGSGRINDREGVYLAARCVADGADIDPELTERLLSILSQKATSGHDDAFVALSSIGWCHPDEVAKALDDISETQTDGRTRLRVAETKAKMLPRSEAIEWLSGVAHDNALEPRYRLTAAWALGRLGNKEEAVIIMRELPRSADVQLDKSLMIEALGEFGIYEAIEVLEELGMDSELDQYYRLKAARMLSKLDKNELADQILSSMIKSFNTSFVPGIAVEIIREQAMISGRISSNNERESS